MPNRYRRVLMRERGQVVTTWLNNVRPPRTALYARDILDCYHDKQIFNGTDARLRLCEACSAGDCDCWICRSEMTIELDKITDTTPKW